MLNGVKLPCQTGGSAERTRAVKIVETQKKRVIFKPFGKYRFFLRETFRKLTASITDLNTSLANMNRNDFPHFRRAKAAQTKISPVW
jgi:hypothetical protein